MDSNGGGDAGLGLGKIKRGGAIIKAGMTAVYVITQFDDPREAHRKFLVKFTTHRFCAVHCGAHEAPKTPPLGKGIRAHHHDEDDVLVWTVWAVEKPPPPAGAQPCAGSSAVGMGPAEL